MATEPTEVPKGFTKAAAPSEDNDDDYDTEWVDRPALGDMLQGMLLDLNPDRGEYDTTVIEVKLTEPFGDFDEGDLVCFWSTNGIDDAIEANDVSRGDELALVCDDTFDTDDGERRTYSVYTKD